MTTARNIAIVLAIAAAVEFLPGGGDAAAIISRILSLAFIAVIVFAGAYLYRRHRLDLESLQVGYRALGYGAVGALVLVFAASARMTATAAGGLAFAAIIAASVVSLVLVWREYRSVV